MTNAQTIRDAIAYEVRNNLTGSPKATLGAFADIATDAELIRFAQLINNVVENSDRLVAPTMDSTDLARANID